MNAPERFLNDRVSLYSGDCLHVLKGLPPGSIDAGLTDPPYHLTSIVKRYGSTSLEAEGTNERRARDGADAAARLSRGFMGKQWDGGDIAFRPEVWIEVLRVLKPGAHLLAFGGTRTYHRLACAIEDAGFEIRDQVQWLYGSGFPKNHDVSKGIDKALGADRTIVPAGAPVKRMIPGADQHKQGWEKNNGREYVPGESLPATALAVDWDGWGTALKPANEPIVLARKPLAPVTSAELRALTGADYWVSERGDSKRQVIMRFERALHAGVRCRRLTLDQKTRVILATEDAEAYAPFEVESVVANVLKWGTGALNIGACRIPGEGNKTFARDAGDRNREQYRTGTTVGAAVPMDLGRWPANLIHDGSDEVVSLFPSEAGAFAPVRGTEPSNIVNNVYGARKRPGGTFHDDAGSAARFFYTPKADADDRIGSKHPTVKPVDLIRYGARLITPPGGTVLDCFAGTGTTGEAAYREGISAILIEREAEYLDDIRRRMQLVIASPNTRKVESLRARGKTESPGPLFAGESA